MKSFIIRAISAFAAASVVVGAYYFAGALALKILVGIAIILSSLEIYPLLFGQSTWSRKALLLHVLVILNASVNFLKPELTSLVLSVSFVLIAISVMLSRHSKVTLEGVEIRIFKGLVAILYAGIMPSFTAMLLRFEQGDAWFFALLLVIFAGDVGAYLAGSLFGAHTMMPSLSPKKSWEGSLGGIVFSILAGWVCVLAGLKTGLVPFLIFCFLVEIAAQQGDFFESLIKRIAHVKDSGTLMPGHGGILDRLDGVFFAAPLFYLFAWMSSLGL